MKPIILITINDPQVTETSSSGSKKGYNGLGISKKTADPVMKLFDDAEPMLSNHLDANGKDITNVLGYQFNSSGTAKNVLKTVDDHVVLGIAEIATVYYSFNFFKNYLELVRSTIGEIDSQADDSKIAVTKEWVLSKLGSGGLTALVDDPNPELAASLNISQNDVIDLGKITNQFKSLFVGDIQSNSNVLWIRANHDGVNAGLLVFSVGQVITIEIDYQTFKTHVPLTPISNLGTSLGKSDLRFSTIYSKSADFSDGANGTFTSQDGKTVTVTNGIITDII